MVLDSGALRGLETLCTHIGQVVDEDMDARTSAARDRFRTDLVRSGGKITALDDPEVYHATEAQLVTHPRTYENQYGIDGSTVPPRKYLDGMVVGFATASCAMLGSGDEDIETRTRIVGSVYHRTDDINLDEGRLADGNQTIDLKLVGEGKRQSGVEDWVRSTALGLAEGRHARAVAANLDGPLFLDGGLYPAYILPEVGFARRHAGGDLDHGEGALKSVSAGIETIQGYVDAIATVVDGGYPIIGVTKTLRTSMMVNALEAKMEGITDAGPVIWSEDSQFLGQVLYTDEPNEITFTSWFEQTGLLADDEHEPLAGFEFNTGETARDYRRAFFFVRLPTETVFRVEAPRKVVETREDRARIQMLALRELADARGPPMVIQRADDQARITKTAQHRLFDQIDQAGIVRDYNRDVRFPDQSTNEDY